MERASPLGRPLLIATRTTAIGLAVARLAGLAVPGWVLALAALALLAVIGAGVAILPLGVFARPILAARPECAAGRFALTFDDGPDPVHTRAILDALESRGHRGTFFVIGARAERHPALLARITGRGHGLGNHSYSHPRFGTFGAPAALCADLERAGAVIERACGQRPRWYRPPVGLISPPIAEAARRAGLELLGWSGTARDGTARATVESALARLIPRLRPGAILVLHDAAERGDREPLATAILPRLLDAAEARGLRSVPLDELLGGDPSQADSPRKSAVPSGI